MPLAISASKNLGPVLSAVISARQFMYLDVLQNEIASRMQMPPTLRG